MENLANDTGKQTPISMEILKEHEEYLDRVALQTMESYLRIVPPKNEKDSVKLATVCYQNALAFLDVKLKLESLALRGKILRKQTTEYKRRLNKNL